MWQWLRRRSPSSSSTSSLEADLSSLLPLAHDVEERVKMGRVTRIETDHVLIDDQFVWQAEHGQVLRLHQEVRVRLEREVEQDHKQWRVVSVEPLSKEDEEGDWNENDTFCFREDRMTELILNQDVNKEEEAFKHVAEVVRVDKTSVTLDMGRGQRRVTIDESLLQLPFALRTGDLLSVLLHSEAGSVSDVVVKKATPLRLKEGVGQVSMWWPHEARGWIDTSVSFELSSVRNEYYPCKKDYVSYVAIECVSGHSNRYCSWRATSVKCQRSPIYNKKDSVPSSKQMSSKKKHTLIEVNCLSDESRNLNLVSGREQSLTLQVANNSTSDYCLKSFESMGTHSLLNIKRVARDDENMLVKKKAREAMEFQCSSHALGSSNETLKLTFEREDGTEVQYHTGDNGSEGLITVFLELSVIVQHPLLDALVRPVKHQNSECFRLQPPWLGFEADEQDANVVPGQRKKFSSIKSFDVRRLPNATIPSTLRNAFMNATDDLTRLYPVLKEPLSIDLYIEKWSVLLFLEELGQSEQLKRFSMSNIIFERCAGDLLKLQVPGMSDKKPSLAMGDSIVASKGIVMDQLKFEGCIQDVRPNSVFLKFDQECNQLKAIQSINMSTF